MAIPGKGGSSHDRAVFAAAVKRAAAEQIKEPIPGASPKNSTPANPPSIWAGLVRFVEQPLFTTAFGIIGGIVGLIIPLFLVLVGLWIVAAFHRARVVTGRSWKVQVASYVLVFAGSFAIVYKVESLLKKAVHIPTTAEIVAGVRAILPPPGVQIPRADNPPSPSPLPPRPLPPALPTTDPLLVLQLGVNRNEVAPGKPIQLLSNMLNTTGRILNVRLLRGWNFALPPTSYAARVKYEDETWKAFAERVASRGVDEQIPARSEGRSNIHIETEPLDAARLDDITNRKLVLYFYNIFQDRKTKEHLVEICVYLNPDLSVQDCANHNKP